MTNDDLSGRCQSTDIGIVDYITRCRLLRAPDERERHAILQSFQAGGFVSVLRLLDFYANNEQIETLSRSSLIERVLSTFTFYQKDMGALNELNGTDVFVISAPKCGTTTITNSYRRSGFCVFAIHNDNWLRYYMPNGKILEALDIKFEEIFKLLNPDKSKVFFGFRDPISWYFALAGELRLQMDNNLKDNLPDYIERNFPWSILSFDSALRILENIVGRSIFSFPFDKDVGYSVTTVGNVDVILYRIEALDSLLSWLARAGEISTAARLRVNESREYHDLVASARYMPRVLDKLFDTPLVEFFYSGEMIRGFKSRYGYC